MIVNKIHSPLKEALSYLPESVSEDVLGVLKSRGNKPYLLGEIRLRADGPCAVVIGGENVALSTRLDSRVVGDIFRRMSGGAAFAHRDEVRRGFIPLGEGVRVGVVGRARYDGGAVVGIGDISSLVIRIPSGMCDFAERLYREWATTGGGMLILSPAGGGKTTAMRSLARLIGSGEEPRRVVVVDERCELDPRDYREAHVDVLRGYERSLGVDIAIRTMSAEVLMVDEISSFADSRAMLAALGAGVTVIATAHAECLDGALCRAYVRELVEGALFHSAAVISRSGHRFNYKLERIDRLFAVNPHGMGGI